VYNPNGSAEYYTIGEEMTQSQPIADPFAQFGSLNFDDDAPPTWPQAGSAKLIIIDKFEPLFTSATWTITASVGDDVIARSNESNKAHTSPFVMRWSREMIRRKYELLRRYGVDAEAEYIKLGGNAKDLKP